MPHYIVNNWGQPNSPHPPGDRRPYYGTDPKHYFGSTSPSASGNDLKPRKLGQIRSHSREWMLADLWSWESIAVSVRASSPQPVGTSPMAMSERLTCDVLEIGPHAFPSYPYHGTMRTFPPSQIDKGEARLSTGRTNAAYFDGHGEPVRRWRGTVNPSFKE